jgi:hypothetical protein
VIEIVSDRVQGFQPVGQVRFAKKMFASRLFPPEFCTGLRGPVNKLGYKILHLKFRGDHSEIIHSLWSESLPRGRKIRRRNEPREGRKEGGLHNKPSCRRACRKTARKFRVKDFRTGRERERSIAAFDPGFGD